MRPTSVHRILMLPCVLPALLVLLVLPVLTACGTGTDGAPPEIAGAAPGHGAWTRVADVPLSPRQSPVVAHVAGEVVVVGGYAGPPCPPNADCVYPGDALRRDGAAYDVEERTWRRIADAPLAVPEMAPSAVVGRHLHLLVDDTLLTWDGATDSWTRQRLPGPRTWASLVADGSRLVVAPGSDEHGVHPDRVLDIATGEWATLPPDPLKPSFDRVVTATPHGLVLTAKPILPDGSPADPALVHAALLAPGARTWRTLPVSDQLGGWRWAWTGHRLVDVTLGGADGGEVNGYGRVIPFGGRLDPGSGTWSRLPDAPAERGGGWPVEAAGGSLVAAGGWLYDDRAGGWTRVARPRGAPSVPGPAVWVGGALVVVGGADWDLADEPALRTPENVWSTATWTWTPESGSAPPPGW